MLVLQCAAVAVLVSYFTSDNFKNGLDTLADFKAKSPWAFSFVSTAIAGGLIPTIINGMLEFNRNRKLRLEGKTIPPRTPAFWKEAIYLFIAWGIFGIEVEAFYRLQVVFFGDSNKPVVVVKKVLVDQLAWNVLWSSNHNTMIYLFRDVNFSLPRLYHRITQRVFWTYTIPLVIMTIWMIWIPSVSIIYCLPNSLQVIVFDIVLCFWSLMVALLAQKQNGDKKEMGQQEQATRDGEGQRQGRYARGVQMAKSETVGEDETRNVDLEKGEKIGMRKEQENMFTLDEAVEVLPDDDEAEMQTRV